MLYHVHAFYFLQEIKHVLNNFSKESFGEREAGGSGSLMGEGKGKIKGHTQNDSPAQCLHQCLGTSPNADSRGFFLPVDLRGSLILKSIPKLPVLAHHRRPGPDQGHPPRSTHLPCQLPLAGMVFRIARLTTTPSSALNVRHVIGTSAAGSWR